MSRKRKQRHNSNSSGGSSNSSTETIKERTCLHWRKSSNMHNIKKYSETTGIRNECLTCEKENVTQQQSVEKDKNSVKQIVEQDNASPEKSVEEDNTSSPDDGIWICLYCGEQHCRSKNKNHTQKHYDQMKNPHQVAISMKNWTIWCYECKKELSLKPQKRLELINSLTKAINKSPTTSPPEQKKNSIKRSPTAKPTNKVNNVKPSNSYNKQDNMNKTKDVKCVVCTVTRPTNVLTGTASVVTATASLATATEGLPVDIFPKIIGLYNLGNTCFFNSVIQVLARTPYLVQVLERICKSGEKVVLPGGKFISNPDLEEVELPPIKSKLEKAGHFTSVLYKTIKDMQNCKTQQSFSPTELLDALKKKSMYCMDGGQHDVHEFIRYLLEVVRDEDVKRYQSVILKELNLQNKSQETVGSTNKDTCKFYEDQLNKKLLGPEQIFKGALVSTLNCSKCGYSSQCTEPFLDLSLPVTAEKPQPPAYKRRNNTFDETFDMKENLDTISTKLSKYQQKREKKTAREDRKNKKITLGDFFQNSMNKPQSTTDYSMSDLDESDADIEDNIGGESVSRETEETGYSSEIASDFSSPVSPANYKINSIQRATTTDNLNLSMDKSKDYKSTDNLETFLYYNNVNNGALKEVSDSSMVDILPLLLSDSDKNCSDSNKNQINQELTATTLSSPVASKYSLMGTLLTVQNVAGSSEVNQVNRTDSTSDNSNDSITDKPISLNSNFRTAPYKKKMINGYSKQKVNVCINDVTSGFSQMNISNNTLHTPGKYPQKDEYSIQSCLNEFTMIELMTGSNEVGCEKCTEAERKIKPNSTRKVRTPHTKQYLISQAPPVLILQLKRFQAYNAAYRKIGKRVEFPMVFDLSPVCTNIKGPRMYALYGVIEHQGSTIHNGHYVAYVKSRIPLTRKDSRWSFLPKKDQQNAEELYNNANSVLEEETAKVAESMKVPPGKWYCVSDTRVTEVDELTVKRSQAYLLFYERIL